jgi:hypothetical protein
MAAFGSAFDIMLQVLFHYIGLWGEIGEGKRIWSQFGICIASQVRMLLKVLLFLCMGVRRKAWSSTDVS